MDLKSTLIHKFLHRFERSARVMLTHINWAPWAHMRTMLEADVLFWPVASLTAQGIHAVAAIVMISLGDTNRAVAMACVCAGAALTGLAHVAPDFKRVDRVWTVCAVLLTLGIDAGLPTLQLVVSLCASGVLGAGLLPHCADMALLWALRHVDTDGAYIDTELLMRQARSWRVPHVSACLATWLGFALLLPSSSLPTLCAELGLLGAAVPVARAVELVWCARIVESPVRFEQVFCSARKLRAQHVDATVSDEDGGVILSLTRHDRVRTLHARFEVCTSLLFWFIRMTLT